MTSKRIRSGNYFVYASQFDELLWRSGITTKRASQVVNRTTRTVRDWRAGKRPVPAWAFRLVQLVLAESYDQWRVLPQVWVYPGDLDLRRQVFGPAKNDAGFGLSGDGEVQLSPSENVKSGLPASDLFLNRQAQGRPTRCAGSSALDRRTNSEPATGYPQADVARASEVRLVGPWITLPDLRRAA